MVYIFLKSRSLWKSLFVCLSVYGWGFQRGVPFGSVEKEIGGLKGDAPLTKPRLF